MTRSTARNIQGDPGDALLIGQLQAGSVEALSKLYDRYGDRAYQVAWCLCLDSDHAERAVQEAFLALWRGRDTYRAERGTVAAWVLSEVRARATDLLSEDEHVHTPVGGPLASGGSRGDVTSGAEQSVAGEDAVRLLTLLAQLPGVQREVIVLAFYGKLTHGEIAASLGLSSGTVKGRMRLGLYTLKDAVDSGVITHTAAPKERALPDEGPPAPQPESLDRRRRLLRVVQGTLLSESGRISRSRSNDPTSSNEQVRSTPGN